MPVQPEKRCAPAGGTGATSDDLTGSGIFHESINLDEIAVEQQRLVGAFMHAPPSVRDRVNRILEPGDLLPVPDDAMSILRVGCARGLTEVGELAEFFTMTVHNRKRAPRKPGDPLPIRYSPGPESWIAGAFTSVARMPDLTSAIVLALPFVGTGRRRAIAYAAAELARAARNPEFDQDDIDAAVARLLKLLGVAS